MNWETNRMEHLARAAATGDSAAVDELFQELLPGVTFVARRTIATGRARTVLERQVLEEYRRLHDPDDDRPPSEELIEIVAQRVAARAAGSRRSVLPAVDRVPTATLIDNRFRANDTAVLACR